MRLLLIEDDAMLGRAMKQGLADAGFTVDWANNGNDAELALTCGVYEAALLDLGLPGKDGMNLLRELRERRDTLPVLIMTARDAVSDRIAGLNAGADDYVLKPFDLDELVARVRALIRRRAAGGSPVLECGALPLDPVQEQVQLDGQPVQLSAKEFALLEKLMQRPGLVLSREKLEDAIYGWGEEVGVQRIRNVRGVGYKVCET